MVEEQQNIDENQEDSGVEVTEIEVDVEEESSDIPQEASDIPQEKKQASEESSAEHEEYSASVKKRIDRLTKKMREAERQKEEAIRYAQNVQGESEKLKQRLQTVDQGYLSEYERRLASEKSSAEADFKKAMSVGDAEATLAAQRRLTDIDINTNKLREAQRLAQRKKEEPPAQQAQVAQQPPVVDKKAEAWASKNEWFGRDNVMTFATWGIHKNLAEELDDNGDPAFDVGDDEYYDELDRRIRLAFPNAFEQEKPSGVETGKKTAQTVAGVSRTSTSAGRKKRYQSHQAKLLLQRN